MPVAAVLTELEANPQSAGLSHVEWLGLLLDREATERYESARHAGEPELMKLIEEVFLADPSHHRGGAKPDHRRPRRRRQELAGLRPRPQGLPRSVLYQRIPRMFGDLVLARGDGRYPRLMRALGGVKLLILDDWGLEPLGPEQRHDMLEIVEDRYGRGATLITSQIPVDRWHDLIGEPKIS